MHTKKDHVSSGLLKSTMAGTAVRVLAAACIAVFPSMLFSGCASIDVPLTSTLDIEEFPARKSTKRVVVVMDKELSEMTQRHKPMALADAFQLEIGESIRSNVLHLAGRTFSEVEFCSKTEEAPASYDYLLEVKLVEANFVMGRTVFSKHKSFLKLDYLFYDSNSQLLFTVNSMSSGEGKATQQEVNRQISFRGAGQVGFKLPMGRAWDIALKDSLKQFASRLNAYKWESSQSR